MQRKWGHISMKAAGVLAAGGWLVMQGVTAASHGLGGAGQAAGRDEGRGRLGRRAVAPAALQHDRDLQIQVGGKLGA